MKTATLVCTILASLLLVSASRLPAQEGSVGASPAPPDAADHLDAGHAAPVPRVRAAALRAVAGAGAGIVLDGRLDEAAWAAAPPAGGFVQQDPREGEPATQPTEVRFLFDDEALYIGARMYDSLGAAGVRTRLARRDQDVEGDFVEFTLDTYHDHTGRTILAVNPSGVKRDAGQAAPFADPSWDPVWEVATSVDSAGWTAELRIPFSQLRFPEGGAQVWGLQVRRYVERLKELSQWSYWGKTEAGGPQRFGHLEGLAPPESAVGVEVMPYAVARASFVQPTQPGSPYQQPEEYGWRLGGDVKALLSSTFTLDATINPDFGQVEVDPAVVNLSAFETFFPERRPFFVEGSGLFGFGGFSCFFCSNVSSLSLFYSRRIGRSPQGAVTEQASHVDAPDATTILGAAKVSGRTASGLQVGILNAVTASEEARYLAPDGVEGTQEVEPLTNYFVGRLRRNFLNGDARVGLMATSVVRRLEDGALRERLPAHAEALGVDWYLGWDQRRYSFMGNFAVTRVAGDEGAILRLQRSSARYFQRPDREHGSNGVFSDRYDPSLTALVGYGGYMRVAKEAGDWRWESAVNFRSPGFEANDLAFLTRADYVWMNANVVRVWTKPTNWYRQANATVGAQQQVNFDGDLTYRQLHAFAGVELPNYWGVRGFVMHRPEVYDDGLTRGGPVVRRPANWSVHGSASTDARKALVLDAGGFVSRDAEGGSSYNLNAMLRLKPASNLSLSLGPSYGASRSTAQYVRAFDDPAATAFHGRRVVFADLERRTFSLDTRLSATFTPTLTLELFLQPFVATGDYAGFKEFDRPRGLEKTYFDEEQIRAETDDAGRTTGYVLDPDRDPGTPDFTFRNPDFHVRSLRGNAVLRWEWRPGSTLFLVWQQQRAGTGPAGDFDFGRDAGAVFREHPDDVFLLKVSYWFGR